jgi:penicillin amidase
VAPAEGSNAWVVAGSRTATGRPILANDPHRAFGHPSLRYLAHLTAPDLDVIGAGEPAMPGVAIGHNDRLAFGLTIFPADQEDLMVYETHPEDPGRYRYGDGWEAMRTVLESVPVRGEPDQEILLKFTRHGPVIHEDPARRRAYAVRTVWLEPGASAYLGSLRYLDAASREEFAAALAHWVAPPVNQLCAETGGRIGWIAAAAVPNRPNWDGLTPVPGNGSHEWNGFLRGEALPRRYDPPDGFIVTANEMNLPPDHPTERQVGFEWMDRFRADRLNAVLGGDRALSVDAARRLQSDHLSAPAVRVVALLAASRIDSGLLAGWDGRIERYSAAAALFEIWWSRHLKPAVLARMAPEPRLAALLAPGDDTATLAVLEHPTPRWSAAERDSLLTATLAAAMAECAARMGPDPAGWSWGLVHRLVFAHSAGRDGDVGPVPLGGSAATVGLGDYRPADLAVLYGASFRMVLDVGEWDRSLAINAPGQSGNPASPHYADLVPLWAEGECVPLLYSTAAVDTATEERILLLP